MVCLVSWPMLSASPRVHLALGPGSAPATLSKGLLSGWAHRMSSFAPGCFMSVMWPIGRERFHYHSVAFSLFLYSAFYLHFETHPVWFPAKAGQIRLCAFPSLTIWVSAEVSAHLPRPSLWPQSLVFPPSSFLQFLWSRIIFNKKINPTLFLKCSPYFQIIWCVVNKDFISLYFNISKTSFHVRK